MTDTEREAFMTLLAELIGLRSAYEKHCRHWMPIDSTMHRGSADPLYATRMRDVDRAIAVARVAIGAAELYGPPPPHTSLPENDFWKECESGE